MTRYLGSLKFFGYLRLSHKTFRKYNLLFPINETPFPKNSWKVLVKLDFRRLMEVEREIFDLMWTELLEIQRKKKKLTRKYFRGFPLEDKLLLEIFGREHNMLQLGVEELLKSLFRAKRVY